MLNDQIIAYLAAKGASWESSDFTTGIPQGGEDQIIHWSEAKLGPQPSQADLDAAYAAAQAEAIKAENKKQAMLLLQATDWTEMPSASDVASSPRLLNKADFVAYRVALRAIAVTPPATSATFPELPTEQWG